MLTKRSHGSHTKHPRSTNQTTARGPKAIGRLRRAFNSQSAPTRAALGAALALALIVQPPITSTATRAAVEQAQPPAGFAVDQEATAQIVRVPTARAVTASVSLSALPAERAEGASAAASEVSAPAFVEPPPAASEPTGAASEEVAKSARRGKLFDKASSDASGRTGKSTSAAAASRPDAAALDQSSYGFPGQSDSGSVAPPDTNGAVGLTRVLTATRSAYVVQDKATGGVLSSVSMEAFWAPTGALAPYNPRALYDPYNHRWLLSALSDARSPDSSVLVAVSHADDPAGPYHLFRFDADPDDQLWADYGSLGFNKNWAVVTFNAHNLAGDGFNQGRALALDYAALLSGVGAHTLFGGLPGGGSFSAHQPAVTYSPDEEVLYLVSHVGSAGAVYRVSAVTGTPSEPVIIVGEQKQLGGLGGWTQPGGETLPQAGGPRKVESPDSRVQKAVFRNGSIYYCQTVGLPAGRTAATVDRTVAQWVRLDSQADYVEGGRVEDPNATPANGGRWYAYPSLSVNQFGDVLVGFTEFASDQSPSAGYATHVGGTTPAGPMPAHIYKAGEGYYERLSPAGRNLWGLYSSAQVDPANDRDVWTIQEYAAAPAGTGSNSGRWGTWWQSVPLPNRPPGVMWTNVVGVSVSGSSLTKTAGDGWNAGASSVQSIPSGDGYFEFTAANVSARMAGLSHGDSDQSVADIDFAVYPNAGGLVDIWESGAYKWGGSVAYQVGDRFRVAVESGAVKYYKISGGVMTHLYTSSIAPTYPLVADASLYYTGAQIGDAVITSTQTSQTSQTWQNLVGVSASGDSLTKTGAEGWNAGASSVQSISSGDGYFEFTAANVSARMAGLSNGDSNQSYADIDFAVYPNAGGLVDIWEGGVFVAGGVHAYQAGDRFRVAVEGGVVKYYKISGGQVTLLHTSGAAPTYPLRADTSFYYTGATVANAVMSGNLSP